MTPRELAEKIESTLVKGDEPQMTTANAVAFIESLLTDALAEARETGNILNLMTVEKIQKEANAAAYEDCAKIAEESNPYSRDEIAMKIRLRAKELK